MLEPTINDKDFYSKIGFSTNTWPDTKLIVSISQRLIIQECGKTQDKAILSRKKKWYCHLRDDLESTIVHSGWNKQQRNSYLTKNQLWKQAMDMFKKTKCLAFKWTVDKCDLIEQSQDKENMID